MKNIYVVTHPEASHHVDGLVGGWFDSELTELGLLQAEAIAEGLSGRLDGAVVETVSSDLRRARRTAEIIAGRLGGALRLDPDLREKSYGEAGGRPKAWLEERRIPLPEFGERLRHDEGVDGAETRMDLAVRAYAAMQRLQGSATDNQIVVTHGGTATFLLAAWIGMPLESTGRVSFGLTSGGITELRRSDRNYSHQIARLNETSHLEAASHAPTATTHPVPQPPPSPCHPPEPPAPHQDVARRPARSTVAGLSGEQTSQSEPA